MTKKYPVILLIVVLSFIASSLFYHLNPAISAPDTAQDKLTTEQEQHIKSIFPEAEEITQHKGEKPHFKIYNDTSLIGIAFYTNDIVPDVSGYAGPIQMLVGLTSAGELRQPLVIEHYETHEYVEGKIETFLMQFEGQDAAKTLVIGQDVDAITQASITSMGIVETLNKSIAIMNPLLGEAQKKKQP